MISKQRFARSTASKADPAAVAASAGLRYVTPGGPGIRRRKQGQGFRYLDERGRAIRDRATLDRVRGLAIPPAYRDVWICTDPKGHLQAIGIDARGRKQYRYHPRWTAATTRFKFLHILRFAGSLPRIRRVTEEDLSRPGLDRRKVLAAVVQLLEKTLIRVGNDEYARSNRSYGLSTLKNRHVEVKRSRVAFRFKGKSGIRHEIDLDDPKLAKVVKRCRELPGQELFQYLDDSGDRHVIHSQDVNEYLRSIARRPYTAKDFRTWSATLSAALALRDRAPARSRAAANRELNSAIDGVARRLGNTRSVCRKSYIHPAIIEAYFAGEPILSPQVRYHPSTGAELPCSLRDEKRVIAFLRRKASEWKRA